MNKYRITADSLKAPLEIDAISEEDAWNKAKAWAWEHTGRRLLNADVEELPTRAELLESLKEQTAILDHIWSHCKVIDSNGEELGVDIHYIEKAKALIRIAERQVQS